MCTGEEVRSVTPPRADFSTTGNSDPQRHRARSAQTAGAAAFLADRPTGFRGRRTGVLRRTAVRGPNCQAASAPGQVPPELRRGDAGPLLEQPREIVDV